MSNSVASIFQLGKDQTEYRLLTKEFVSEQDIDGRKILKVEKFCYFYFLT